MRSALLTNSGTAAAKVVPNPNTVATTAGQAASSQQGETSKVQDGAVLSKNRGPSNPKKTDGIFEGEESDRDGQGAAREALRDRADTSRSLLTVV
ncbi:hypothetical protein MRY87_01925 [bacterium]|nr:hypothetical protein [bacterium]